MKSFNSQNIYLIVTLLIKIESSKLSDIQLKDNEITFIVEYDAKNERKFANTIMRFEQGDERLNISEFAIIHNDLHMASYLLRKGKLKNWLQFNFKSVSKYHILSAEHKRLKRVI